LAAAGWNVVPGGDPDADWGDGGSWSLRDTVLSDLAQFRRIGVSTRGLGAAAARFGNLVGPIPQP